VDFDCPVTLGGVPVQPGDFILGDADGVVVIPQALAIDVLLEAEQVVADENEVRQRVRNKESVAELYMQFKRF
jgi:regulator of RNase E activity RraA